MKFQIQGGDTNANAAAGTSLGLVNRFCGRELLPARDTAWAAATTDATAVCSKNLFCIPYFTTFPLKYDC